MKLSIREREKGKNRGYTAVKTSKKVKLVLDLNILDLMCAFSVSDNRNLRRSHFVALRNLICALDTEIYMNDMNKLDRIRFIEKVLDLRLNKGITSPDLLISGATGGISMEGERNEALEEFKDLSNSEMDYLNDMIAGALKRTYLENSVDKGLDILTRYKTGDYRYSGDIINEWEQFVKEENNRIRSAKVEKVGDAIFTLRSDMYDDIVGDIYDKVTNPSRLFWTGMQGFNMLVGDALEATRVYMLLGLAGVGKSLTLLDLALQIKEANRGYKPKDPTKIPTILYLTQENSMEETIERIFSMLSNGGKMKNYTKQQVKEILLNGGLFLSEEDNINILVMYKPDRSIDTSDLYTIVEDLEDDGYEVILLLQDHIKRILPVSHNPDIRLGLGETVNEFKVFAQLKEIPVISVAHLNRDAAKTVDENARGNKQDLTRLLGRGNIGESMLMIDNADCVIIINKEYDAEGKKYMIFKGIKLRNAACMRDYICQPYELDNPSRLVRDLHCAIPAFKESLLTMQAPVNMNVNPNIKAMPYTDLDDLSDNIFVQNGMSSYSSTFAPGAITADDNIFKIEDPSGVIDLTPKTINISNINCLVEMVEPDKEFCEYYNIA